MGDTLSAPAAAPADSPWLGDPIVAVAPAASADQPWLSDPIVKAAVLGPWAAPVGGEFGDLSAQPWAQGEQPSPTSRAPAAKIIDAAVQGWKDTPAILTPVAQSWLEDNTGRLGDQLINPVFHLAGAIPAAANALTAGVSQAAMETLGEKGGRDALALLASAPMAAGERMSPEPPAAVAAPAEAVRPQFVSERLAPPDPHANTLDRITQLINHDNAENPSPVATPVTPAPSAPATSVRSSVPVASPSIATAPLPVPAEVSPPAVAEPAATPAPVALAALPPIADPNPLLAVAEPSPAVAPRGSANQGAFAPPANGLLPPEAAPASAPRSVGAAASRDLSDPGTWELTPAQTLAYRSTAEGQKLLERQPAGVPDATPYIEGVKPNEAEIEQTVNAARELKSLNITAPDVSQAAKNIAAANNEARITQHQATVGSDVDVMNAKAARDAQRQDDYPAAFANKGEADTAPVVAAVRGALDDPRGRQNTQLKAYVKPLLDRLVNSDGSMKITDPEELYGFREDLARMRSKASQVGEPNLQHVSGELGDIITAADGAIERAAPGYRAYMDNFANASRGIDQMEVLQKHEPRIYDAQNRITYGKVQTMMRQIVDARQARGLNPYKSISDDTMARLWALRDDLRRSATARELASAPGSDTAQNAFDAVKGAIAGQAGTFGATLIGGLAGGPFGAGVAGFAKDVAGKMLSGRTARRQTARGMQMLNPPTTLNALTPMMEDGAGAPLNRLMPP